MCREILDDIALFVGQNEQSDDVIIGVEILSWCLMTNHVHFIAVPGEDTSFARGFGEAHRRYTRMKNFSDGVRGYLFQGRFGSCVLDERHLMAAAHYVETTPVRAGIVKEAWDYPCSSAAYHIGKTEADILVEGRNLMGLIEDWQSFLADAADRQPEALRLATRGGVRQEIHHLSIVGQLRRSFFSRSHKFRDHLTFYEVISIVSVPIFIPQLPFIREFFQHSVCISLLKD